MPFIPPPPSCAARRDHDAGSTTLKLIGLAVLAVSIGAITPFRRQCAGTPLVASTHDGADNVTLRTGSPIADVATVAPNRSAVHSAAVRVFGVEALELAAGTALAWPAGAGVASRNAAAAATSMARAPPTDRLIRMCSLLADLMIYGVPR
jgi:hypothetical protein